MSSLSAASFVFDSPPDLQQFHNHTLLSRLGLNKVETTEANTQTQMSCPMFLHRPSARRPAFDSHMLDKDAVCNAAEGTKK